MGAPLGEVSISAEISPRVVCDEEQVSWWRGDLNLELGDLGEVARLVGDEEHELVRAGKLLEESCLCLRRRARRRHPSVSCLGSQTGLGRTHLQLLLSLGNVGAVKVRSCRRRDRVDHNQVGRLPQQPRLEWRQARRIRLPPARAEDVALGGELARVGV